MTKLTDIGSLMSRNTPVVATLKPGDAYRAWLITKGAVAGHSLRELEKSFFAHNGGSGRTYTELMGTFLAGKGYTGGQSLKDNWRRFCNGGTV